MVAIDHDGSHVAHHTHDVPARVVTSEAVGETLRLIQEAQATHLGIPGDSVEPMPEPPVRATVVSIASGATEIARGSDVSIAREADPAFGELEIEGYDDVGR